MGNSNHSVICEMSTSQSYQNELTGFLTSEGIGQFEYLAVNTRIVDTDVCVREVMKPVLGRPGTSGITKELHAGSEFKGEVKTGRVVHGYVPGRDKEASVAEQERLDAMGWCDIDALSERAEASGVGPATVAGARKAVSSESG